MQIESVGGAYDFPVGSLVFAADSGVVPLQTCSWQGANMSLVLSLRNGRTGAAKYILPNNAQVGRLELSGGVAVQTSGPFAVLSPLVKLESAAGGPYFDSSGGTFDPSLTFLGDSSLVVAHSVSVMGLVDFAGNSNVTIVGPNVVLSASAFRFSGGTNTIRLVWNSTCADPKANAFPQLYSNGLFCLRTSCLQADFGGVKKKRSDAPFDYVIDTGGVSFTANTTFSTMDERNNTSFPANPRSVTFVNTGGLSYSWAKTLVTKVINGTSYQYAVLYFYQTTASIPGWYPCSNTACQQVQVGPGQVINTCDSNAAVTVTENATFSGNLTTQELSVDGATVTFRTGTRTVVTGRLSVAANATLRFENSSAAQIGSGALDGAVVCGDFVTITASAPVVLSSSALLQITNRLNGAAMRGTSFTFGGRLFISLTGPLFKLQSRDTVTATQTVTVAQVRAFFRVAFFFFFSFLSRSIRSLLRAPFRARRQCRRRGTPPPPATL